MTAPDDNLSSPDIYDDEGDPVFWTPCSRCRVRFVRVLIGSDPETHRCEDCKLEATNERPTA